jgi:hypothetical protein
MWNCGASRHWFKFRKSVTRRKPCEIPSALGGFLMTNIGAENVVPGSGLMNFSQAYPARIPLTAATCERGCGIWPAGNLDPVSYLILIRRENRAWKFPPVRKFWNNGSTKTTHHYLISRPTVGWIRLIFSCFFFNCKTAGYFEKLKWFFKKHAAARLNLQIPSSSQVVKWRNSETHKRHEYFFTRLKVIFCNN